MTSIFQTKEWESLKLQTGYQKSYWIDGILVLQKNLPFNQSMLYSPMVTLSQVKSLKLSSYKDEIAKIGKENNSIFYRIELDIPKELSTFDFRLWTRNFYKSFEQMQPENTWLLGLASSEEELLADMSMRCRYNIKLAKKSGVMVKSALGYDEKMLDDFYSLYCLTGKRHNISFRSRDYFQKLLEILGERGYARIYSSSVEKDGEIRLLSSGIVIYHQKTATYMFGASSNDYRNLKAPNLMVWQMILDAKEKGCDEFDFFGIAPNDDPNHPWAGITSFKKQFGGYEKTNWGSYDQIFSPLKYRAFQLVEKIRRH